MTFETFVQQNPQCVCVEIVAAKGSTPREQGTKMLVGEQSIFRTIGGGQLEYMAIDEARRMIRQGVTAVLREIALGPELGQCCGGVIQLNFTAMDQSAIATYQQELKNELEVLPHVYVFGAGHVGKALADAFSLLPLQTHLVETRSAELSPLRQKFSDNEKISFIETPLPEGVVRSVLKGSVFIILTHDHALDYLISSAALMRRDAAFVGMIGSKTKRALFEKFHLGEGGNNADLIDFTCPIGGETRDKRPEVIAAKTVAEVFSTLTAPQNTTSLPELKNQQT